MFSLVSAWFSKQAKLNLSFYTYNFKKAFLKTINRSGKRMRWIRLNGN